MGLGVEIVRQACTSARHSHNIQIRLAPCESRCVNLELKNYRLISRGQNIMGMKLCIHIMCCPKTVQGLVAAQSLFYKWIKRECRTMPNKDGTLGPLSHDVKARRYKGKFYQLEASWSQEPQNSHVEINKGAGYKTAVHRA